MDKLFLEAVASNNLELVSEYLKSDPKITNIRNVFSIITMIKSCEMVSLIFSLRSAEIFDSYKKCHKSILMHLLILEKNFDIVKEIISFKYNIVNAKCKRGMTPLIETLLQNNQNVEVVKFLLDNYADVNESDYKGNSPLHLAKSLEIIKLLIEKGANVNCTNRSNMTPVMKAIKCGTENEVIFELIRSGTDLDVYNDEGETALHLALAFKRDEDVIWEIVNRTNNLNAVDSEGLTPLCYALNEENRSLRCYSKEFICDLISMGLTFNNYTFLYALKYSHNTQLIKEFINNYKVNLKYVDPDGNNVLHYVSDHKFVGILLRNGALIDHKNSNGWTPLMEEVYRCKNFKKIEALLFWGADSRMIFNDFFLSIYNLSFTNIPERLISLIVMYNGLNVSLKFEPVARCMACMLYSVPSCYNRPGYSLLRQIFLNNENITIPKHFLMNCKVRNVVDSYNSEIDKMKSIYLMDNLSFYNFCTKHYKLNRYHIDFLDCDYTKNDYDKIRTMFPIFCDEIIVKFKIYLRVKNRLQLLRKLFGVSLKCLVSPSDGDSSNSDSNFFELDHDSLYLIGSYLNDRQIDCLLAAAIQE